MLNNIMTRRSVRAFTNEAVDEKLLETIVKTGPQAPSASGRQFRQYTVLTNREILDELAKRIKEELELDKEYAFYHAQALILVSVPKDYQYGEADGSAAMENILLSAHKLGLGAVWINQLRTICDRESIRQMLDDFQIPKEHWVMAAAAIGHPQEDPSRIKESSEVIHWVK